MSTGILWHVFHTSGDPASDEYGQMAMRLKGQLEAVSEECVVVDMGPRNGWMGSCLRRAPLLLEKMNPDRPVGLLDADIEILKPLPWMIEPHEFMVVDLGDGKPRQKRMSAAIVAFQGERGMRTLLDWAIFCQDDLHKTFALREQMYLLDAWDKARPSTLAIKPAQHYVPKAGDKPPWPKDAVLLHWPASRRLRGAERM